MRSLGLAVTLLFAAIAHAAPTLEFYSDDPQVGGSFGRAIIANTSEETAHDVVVRLDWSEGLLVPEGLRSIDLECVSSTCTIAEFPPNAFASVFFRPLPANDAGGHHSATATLTARDIESKTVTFDIITSHHWKITSGADFGEGSLRAALEEFNANPLCGTEVPCTIEIGERNGPPIKIAPSTPLPPIRKCNVWISAYDEPEFPLKEKRAEISGENAWYGNGLEIRASCASGIYPVNIQSIAIHSWPWNGIHFEAPAPHGEVHYPHNLYQMYIGTDRSGEVAKPNRSRGINIDSPYEWVVASNSIVSYNGRSGVSLWRGKQVDMQSMKLVGNGGSGFFSNGVSFQLWGSEIAHNAHFGVSATRVTNGEAQITHNQIHSNAGLPIDWNLDGRTIPDDESDGILNVPQLLDAVYDEATGETTVRGVVRLTSGAMGGSFGLYFYRAISTRGDTIEMFPFSPQRVYPPLEGTDDVPFEITFEEGHMPRGTLIAAQMISGELVPTWSSEISEAVPVR